MSLCDRSGTLLRSDGLSSQLLGDVLQASRRIGNKEEAGLFMSVTQDERVASSALKENRIHTPEASVLKKRSSNWQLSLLAASKNPLEKYTLIFFYIHI